MRKLEDFEEYQRENPKGISAADKQREPSRIAISSTKLHATERVERALPSLPHKQKAGFPHASAFGLQHRPEAATRIWAGPSGGRSPFRFSACPPLSRSSPDRQRQGKACPASHSEGKMMVRPLLKELVRR